VFDLQSATGFVVADSLLVSNCRCLLIPRTIEDAADAGVKEAKLWLRTGTPPARPAFTTRLPFALPKGWVPTGRELVAAV
jgi:hypothetical protein